MFQFRRGFALQFRNDALGQHLPQLNPPLVKRINLPNHALNEDAVLIKCNQCAKNFRRQFVRQNDVRGPVSLKRRGGAPASRAFLRL